MATKTCPSCLGSGYNSMSGVTPGSQNAPICPTCGGKGWVYDNSHSYEGGKNGGCFAGSTKIKVPGGWKKIQDLKAEDSVVSLNINGALNTRRVLKAKKLLNRKTLTVITETSSLDVTPSHSIRLSDGRWKRISKLAIGDSISLIDSADTIKDEVILKISKSCSTTVYNLIIEEDYNFITQSCVAHSFSYFKLLKKLYFSTIQLINNFPRVHILPKVYSQS